MCCNTSPCKAQMLQRERGRTSPDLLGESDGREGHQLCVPQDLDLELDELGDRREGQSTVYTMSELAFADGDGHADVGFC